MLSASLFSTHPNTHKLVQCKGSPTSIAICSSRRNMLGGWFATLDCITVWIQHDKQLYPRRIHVSINMCTMHRHTHIGHRLQSMNVINFRCDQFPNGRLNFDFGVRHAATAYKLHPTVMHILQIIQCVIHLRIVIIVVGRLSLWHTSLGIAVQ